jgi:c-di-GMP-binding flagellar brake protein YcgR
MHEESRRAAQRRFVEEPVELRFDHSSLQLFGESRNMSETGMLIVAEDPKPPGTPIRFIFPQFQGRAEVVWRRESEEGALMGLRFTQMDLRDRAALARILRHAAPYL